MDFVDLLGENLVGKVLQKYSKQEGEMNLINTNGYGLGNKVSGGGAAPLKKRSRLSAVALSLGLVLAPFASGVASAQTFTPTLDQATVETNVKSNISTTLKALAPEPTPPSSYTGGGGWDGYVDYFVSNLDISSSYMVTPGVTSGDINYFTTFDYNGTTYGVLLKTPDGGTSNTIAGIVPRIDPASGTGAETVGGWQIKQGDGGSYDFTVDGEDFSLYNEDGTTSLAQFGSRQEITTNNTTHTGNFIGNGSSSVDGGAINNTASDVTIIGDFIGNKADDYGGAISNSNNGTITTLTGDFIGNKADDYGGAIYNSNGTITTLTGDFIGNSATFGGAIYNDNLSSTITTLTGDFIGNTANVSGGAINNNYSTITTLTGDFIGNTAGSASGGAICNSNGIITTLTGDFIGNKAGEHGGAIYNFNGTITALTGDFIGNTATESGGAIYYHYSPITAPSTTLTGSFIDNHVTRNDGTDVQGGAIWTSQSLTFKTDGADYIFSGNYTSTDGGTTKDYNAIYIEAHNKTLTFDLANGGSYTLNDNVRASSPTYTFNITGQNATTDVFNLNNALYNAKTVTVNNATLNFGSVTHETTEYKGDIGNAALNITNNGVVNVNEDDTTFDGAVDNSGTINAYGAGIIFNGKVTSTGTFNVDPGGGGVKLKGDENELAAVEIGTGTLVVDGDTTFKGNIKSIAAARLEIYGATATFKGDGSSELIIEAQVENSGIIEVASATTFKSSVAFNLDHSALTVNNGATATVANSTYKDISGATVTIESDSTLDLASATIDGGSLLGKYALEGGTLRLGDYSMATSSLVDIDDLDAGEIGFRRNNGGTLEAVALTLSDDVVSGDDITLNVDSATIKAQSLIVSDVDFDGAVMIGSSLTGFEFTGGGNISENLTVNGALTVSAPTIGDVAAKTTTLASGKILDIATGGGLNVKENASLDTSGGNLTVASDASNFATENGAVLKAKDTDFGTFINSSGTWAFTQDGSETVAKDLANAGNLTLTDSGIGTISQEDYNTLIASIGSLATTGTGTITIDGATPFTHYSLNTVPDNTGVDDVVTAGTLASPKEVRFYGVIADGATIDSTIENGATLTLTGGGVGHELLDQGSITNQGNLYLGLSGAGYTANFNGVLLNENTANVLSDTIFAGAVTSNGTFEVSGGATATLNGVSTLTNVTNAGTLDLNADTVFTGIVNSSGLLDVAGGQLATFNDAASLASANLNSGGLFLTKAWGAGGLGDAAYNAIGSFTGGAIDGRLIAGQNSYFVLGTANTTWAADTFANSNYTWGNAAGNVSSAMFIDAPQTLAATGAIDVNGTLTTASAPTANSVNYAAGSLLVVNANNLTAGTAALTATNGTLTVDNTAQLLISGGVNGQELVIVDGFTGVNNSASTGWGISDFSQNLTTDSILMEIGATTYDHTAGSYTVTLGQLASENPYATGGANELFDEVQKKYPSQTAGNNQGINHVNRIVGKTFMGNGTQKEQAGELQKSRSLASIGGTGRTGLSVAEEFGKTINDEIDPNKTNDASAGDGLRGLNLWARPMYKWSEVSGVKSGAFTSGYESTLGGLALGGHYDVNGSFKVGLAFNAGAGEVDSTGDFSGTNNDFDFYGLAVYSSYQYQNFGLTFDVGYNAIDSDLTQTTDPRLQWTNNTASTDTKVWTAGLNAEYTFNTAYLDITPHAGVRYLNVTTDQYNTVGNGGVMNTVAEDTQELWQFPVGVEFSKSIEQDGGWLVTPSVDLGVVFSTGDLEATSRATTSGLDTVTTYTMQNVDGVAFKGGAGLEFASDSGFGLSFDYNIEASDHETSHAIFATARYSF